MSYADGVFIISRPSKVRSKVTVKDFKKYKPKIVVERSVPPVVNKPRRVCSRAVVNRNVQVRRQPNQVELRTPVKPPEEVLRRKREFKPEKVFKRELSEIRHQALRRGRVASPKSPVVVRSRSAPKGGGVRNAASSVSRIDGLRDIGVGRVLVMIAAGPSVLEVDFGPICKHSLIDYMCINKPFKPLWPTKFWVFCDYTQQRANVDTWNNYDGIIINSPNVKARKYNQIIIKNRPGKGFNVDVTSGYHIGRSSTYANMQVAAFMNYERIYIMGCDMAPNNNGQLYHYGSNPDVPNDRRQSRFPIEAQSYLWAGQHLPEAFRKKYVFCSSYNPWPFVNYFGRLDHKVAVEEILKFANNIKK